MDTHNKACRCSTDSLSVTVHLSHTLLPLSPLISYFRRTTVSINQILLIIPSTMRLPALNQKVVLTWQRQFPDRHKLKNEGHGREYEAVSI